MERIASSSSPIVNAQTLGVPQFWNCYFEYVCILSAGYSTVILYAVHHPLLYPVLYPMTGTKQYSTVQYFTKRTLLSYYSIRTVRFPPTGWPAGRSFAGLSLCLSACSSDLSVRPFTLSSCLTAAKRHVGTVCFPRKLVPLLSPFVLVPATVLVLYCTTPTADRCATPSTL